MRCARTRHDDGDRCVLKYGPWTPLQPFEVSIWNTDKTEKTPTCCITSVDGNVIDGPVIGDGDLYNVADICGVENRRTGTLRRLVFRRLKVTGDRRAANTRGRDAVGKLGSIRIDLYRVKVNGWKDNDEDDESVDEDGLQEDAVVHESEKIMNGHCVGLGEEEPHASTVKNLDFDYLDEDPFITFEFRYAPCDILLSLEGVVPDYPISMNTDSDGNLPDLDAEGDDALPRFSKRKPARHVPRASSTSFARPRRASTGEVQSVKLEDEQQLPLEHSQDYGPLQLRRSRRKRPAAHADDAAESQPVRRSPRKRIKVEDRPSSERRTHGADDLLESQPVRRSTRKRLKVEGNSHPRDMTDVVPEQVKEETIAEAKPLGDLDRTEPRIGRTVKVDADDYVAALEAQNRALQALLPERERVRIIKNEPLHPIGDYKPGEVIDLSDE